MKNTYSFIILALVTPLLASCHGVYVDANYAEGVYEHIASVYDVEHPDLAPSKYTYSAKEVSGDTEYEYCAIYSKNDSFYYHYRIGKTWSIPDSEWISDIHESWRYVTDNADGNPTIYRAERYSGTNYDPQDGCYSFSAESYSDSVWAGVEVEINSTLFNATKTKALPVMKTYIEMAQSSENVADILFASSNENSLYVDSEEPLKEGATNKVIAKVAILDYLLESMEYRIDDKHYISYSCDFDKAVVTYPNLSGNSCTK